MIIFSTSFSLKRSAFLLLGCFFFFESSLLIDEEDELVNVELDEDEDETDASGFIESISSDADSRLDFSGDLELFCLAWLSELVTLVVEDLRVCLVGLFVDLGSTLMLDVKLSVSEPT